MLDPEFDVNASLRAECHVVMRRRMLKSAAPANVFAAAMDVRNSPSGCPAASTGSSTRSPPTICVQGRSDRPGRRSSTACRRSPTGSRSACAGRADRRRGDADARPDASRSSAIPGLRCLLFLAAAAGGFWMAWTILAGDVRRRVHGETEARGGPFRSACRYPDAPPRVPCAGMPISSGWADTCALTMLVAAANGAGSPAR